MSNSPTPPPPREGQRHTPTVTLWECHSSLYVGDITVNEPGRMVGGRKVAEFYDNNGDRDTQDAILRAHNAAAAINACLPFPSPATDVPRLIAACKPFLDAADQRADWRCRNPGWNPDAHIEITMRHSELAALLAALPPEVRP